MTEPNARGAGAALPRPDQLRLIMLDCDGVLFDSWKANVAFYNAVLDVAGLPPLDDHGERLCHTLSSPQLYATLFGAEPALHRRVTDAAARVDYTPFFDLMVPAPALEDSLARMASHCALALATNRGRTVAGLVERFGLETFFTIRVGILDVARPKPAPDLLHACLSRADVPASAAVYVGDTELDRAAAAEAGVAYVGVGTASGARYVVGELRELPALLLD